MKTRLTIGILLTAIALLAMAPAAGMADQHEEVSNPDVKCLKCHSRNLKKQLEDGEKMSLRIDVEQFETSVHRVIGCTGCHRDVAKGKHPSREPIKSRRDYSLKHNETCGQCHEAKSTDYQSSIHASLVKDGDSRAPLCSDCHSSHAIQQRTGREAVTEEPCSRCHQDIDEAYTQSIHGHARISGNEIRGDHVRAPLCSDCHKAHDINPVATTDYLVSTCTNCHEIAELAHKQWLPNAAMHMKSVGCAVCHAPETPLRVDLQLYDRARQAPVRQNASHGTIESMLAEIDADGDGLDSVELWKLMRQPDQEGQKSDIILRGRLEVASAIDAHRLAASTEAIRSCENCHQGNAEAFQNVTVSISRPDGRRESFKVNNKVLSSPISVDTVGGFYAPGGTRIKLLDILLVLALVGGLAVPIGHFLLGKYLRKKK